MKNVVDVNWLYDRLGDQQLRIIDCRFSLQHPNEGRLLYEKEHIPGAVYFDLEKDLSGKAGKHGGRHPLPQQDQLKELLEKAGIDHATTVIAYDGGEGAFASRCWWLLRYFGHDKVYVLDGGIRKWKENGYLLDHVIPAVKEKTFIPMIQENMIINHEGIQDIVQGKTMATLIDSRAKERYAGIQEPIDRVPGHIPGAVNKDWVEGLKDGLFLSGEKQEERFSDFSKTTPLIVYCGSGITATPNVLALEEAGYTNVKLYPGSYSDWISYEENEIETGEIAGSQDKG
ncbi:sulfurtransferase [Jeotgalibacillus soli]|uniref:Rhodanese domain-containing protein n=1 Tax=Jeotgalibacillus soli TaxID=889306 RepID=A0A0C2VJH9_9BACL|nr:sulfurtransferase [Jeotgalibacillus soli]KIL44153.1 hypothetical protein KP78_31170 [Jeotgalibacillus soli]